MKIPFLPAALLTMAAILVGCTKEQNSPETMDLGKPFVVHVLNNGKGTRGQAITAVSSFNMVGIQGASNKWMDNLLFTNPGDGWVAAGHEDLRWPGGTGKHTFGTSVTVGDGRLAAAGSAGQKKGRFFWQVPRFFRGPARFCREILAEKRDSPVRAGE